MATTTHRMPTLLDAYQPIVDALEAAGIRVSADVGNIHPPCVFVPPPELSFRFHKADFTAAYRVTVVVALTERLRSIAALSDLLARVLEALRYAPTTATAVDVTTADGSPALPGYELSWSAAVGRGLQ